jgi:hypothetical protein
MAIVASKLMNKFFQVCYVDNHVATQYLASIPIHRIAFTTPENERARLLAKAQSLYNAGDPDALLAFTAACLAADPEQSDVIHDLLAYLAEQMTALHRQKQQRVEDFTLDLEGVTDPDTFAKLQKGKQGRTLWKAGACRPFVEEDSYTTHHIAESLGWDEACFKVLIRELAGDVPNLSRVVHAYRTHAASYAALTQRIAFTDRLIDRIVYQLYGLTDDEVAVVEAASSM